MANMDRRTEYHPERRPDLVGSEVNSVGGNPDSAFPRPFPTYSIGHPYPRPAILPESDLPHQEKGNAQNSQDRNRNIGIPDKKCNRPLRYLRWNFGSVYRRIFTIAFIANMATLLVLAIRSASGAGSFTYRTAATAVSVNLLVSIAVRNEHVVNSLFIVIGSWPQGAPLGLRRMLAKVYSYGGIHSSCAVAAFFWYISFLADFMVNFHHPGLNTIRTCIIETGFAILLELVIILIFAHPRMRIRHHDGFECTHRFLGWSLIVIFWAQIFLLASAEAEIAKISLGASLVALPSFWIVIAITLLVIYPWTHLRLRDVEAEALSNHCVKLNFKYAKVHYGQVIRITNTPLWETHAFAAIPNARHAESDAEEGRETLSHAGEKGFSVLVSNAGDWTSKTIRNPPSKIYTRGVPQYGVLRVAGLFSPVVIVATGSGIGPCMSLFMEKPWHPVRIVWSAKSPEETYGRAVVNTIYRTDPDAIVIDTEKVGRPDLVNIVYSVWKRGLVLGRHGSLPTPCEAVVVISNQKVTRKVVYGLESRGIPAYGAIFDS